MSEQGKETEEFNNADRYIEVITNKKPNIEILKCSERTASNMKITAMATDGDGESLTYKLFVGTTKDNLIEQTEIKENTEQGTEVSWVISVADSTSTYYYKIIVSDKYANIESSVRETNNAPILGEVTIEKGLDDVEGNWIEIRTTATDKENDKLTYIFKIWLKEEGKNEEELVQQEPTRMETKTDIQAGEEVKIRVNGLEEYQDYVYRVDVADNDNNVIGTKNVVKTYCSGTGLWCIRWLSMFFMFRNSVIVQSILQSHVLREIILIWI